MGLESTRSWTRSESPFRIEILPQDLDARAWYRWEGIDEGGQQHKTQLDMDGRGGWDGHLDAKGKSMADQTQEEGIAQAQRRVMEPPAVLKNLGEVQGMSMRSSRGSVDETIERSEVVATLMGHNPTFQILPSLPNPLHVLLGTISRAMARHIRQNSGFMGSQPACPCHTKASNCTPSS